jgi:branched-chain amino acid transport system substrate-binding protein
MKQFPRGAKGVVVIAAIAIASMVGLAGCSGTTASSTSTASATPYKIGFNDDLSGPIAFAGVSNLAGFQTYIDQVNSTGGVNGHKIDLTSLDSKADAATSITNYKQLASQDGDIGVFGNSASSAWIATAPLAETYKVPMLGFGNADQYFTTFDKWMFKNSITNSQQVALQGELVSDTLFKGKNKGLKVGALETSTASGPQWLTAVQAVAKSKGWDLSSVQTVDIAATDCSAQAALLVQSGAQVIISDEIEADVVCASALIQRGFKGKIIETNSGIEEKTFQTLASPQWIAMRTVNWWSDKTTPGTSALISEAKKFGTYSKLGDYSSDGYVAAQIAVAALKRCGAPSACTGTKYDDALAATKNLDTNGVAGPNLGFTTGPNGHTIPNVRFFVWSASKKQSVPLTAWLCAPSRCAGS